MLQSYLRAKPILFSELKEAFFHSNQVSSVTEQRIAVQLLGSSR